MIDSIAELARHYFDRPARASQPRNDGFEDPFAAREEWLFPGEALRDLALLHERYAEWGRLYTAAQLSQGEWAMFSEPGWHGWALSKGEVPFWVKERFLWSLAVPFLDYVKGWNPGEEMPHGFFMLWHLVLPHEPLERSVGQVALESLEMILSIDDERCQMYALHGLNHLDHPDRAKVVQAWMDRERNRVDPWVTQCRDGEAM